MCEKKNRALTVATVEFLILFALVVYHELFRPGRIAAFGLANDLKLFFLPRLLWAVNFVKANWRVPLWDPYTFSGMPFVGNMQSPVYYPVNWLALVLEPWRFFNLYFVLQALGAGLAAFALARRMRLSHAAAALCAVAYEASGFYVAHLYGGHAGHMGNYPWLPLQMLAAWELVGTRKLRWAVALAFFGAIQFISGHPQFFLYSATFVAVFAVVAWFAEGRKELLRTAAVAAVGALLLVGLAAFWLLPGLEFKRLMPDAGAGGIEYATSFSLSVSDVARLAFGRRAAFAATDLPTYWETCGYVGMITLVLAGAGAWLGRKRAVPIFLCVAAILMVLFAMGKEGGVFYFFYKLVPGYNGFRAPARMLMVYSLAVALLAAFGLDDLLGLQSDRRKSALVFCGCALGAAVALILAMWGAKSLRNAWGDACWAFARPGTLLAAGATLLGVLAVGFRMWGAGWIAVGALAVDLATFAVPLIKTVSYDELLWPSKMVERIAADKQKPFRITMPRPDNSLTKAHLARAAIEATQLSHDASGFAHFEQLMLGKRGSLHEARNAHYCRLLNIKYLISKGRADVPGFEFVMEEKPPRDSIPNVLYRFKDFRSRAFLVGRTVMLPKSLLLRSALEKIDTMTTAYVEDGPAVIGETSWHKEAEISDYKVDEFTVEAETDRVAFLVITQIWHPGWRIYDGAKELPVYRTDGAFLGTPLGPGRHRLRVVYFPNSIRIGRWITLGTIALIVGCAFLGPLVKKRIRIIREQVREKK